MNSMKKIRTSLGYTQEKFAALLHVSRATVAMWETGRSDPGYETIRVLSNLFNISADFVIGSGVFEHWDDIITYFDSVNHKLDQMIPPNLMMPTFCADKWLTAWLDQTLYENDELQVARWFAFAVKTIKINPIDDTPDGIRSADVYIEFTEEFNALINDHLRKQIANSETPKSLNVVDGFNSLLNRHDSEKKVAASAKQTKITSPYSSEAMDIAKRYSDLDIYGKDTVRAVVETEENRVKEQAELDPDLVRPEPKVINLFREPAAAGLATPTEGQDYEFYELKPTDPQGAAYAVRLQGDSMEPYFPDGSIVFVNHDALADGDIGIFCVDGGTVCKQYHRDALGMIYLFSLNRNRSDADILISPNSDRSFVCQGRVITRQRYPLPR